MQINNIDIFWNVTLLIISISVFTDHRPVTGLNSKVNVLVFCWRLISLRAEIHADLAFISRPNSYPMLAITNASHPCCKFIHAAILSFLNFCCLFIKISLF